MARQLSATSLRRTLLWRLALALLTVGIVSAFASYRTALKEANQAHDRTLLASTRSIAERIHVTNGRVTVNVPYGALDTFQIDARGRIFYRVLDPAGHFVSGEKDFPAMPANVPRSEDYPALVHFYDDAYGGTPLRVAALWQPVTEGGQRGVALVQVGETLEMRDDMARRLLFTMLWQQAAMIGVSMTLLALTVAATLRPLKRLQDRIQARRASDLAPVEGDDLPREIQPLLQTLNQYLERLRVIVENQKRFLDDAAHQLRTSLTLVRGHVDQRIRASDHGGDLAEVKAAIDRTVRLTNQLLTLARTGDGDVLAPDGDAMQRIELGNLCRDICAEWYLHARERRQDLSLGECPAAAWVVGNEAMLREMLANLLHNAVSYTPAGGSISVTVERSDSTLCILVDDSGPGIPSAERERVFERFVRIAGTPGAGSGLGLSIVRQICEAHQGSVRLESGEKGGLRVRVTLPTAPAAPPAVV
ncbi:sensor histidine kinase [Cupriavidus metallidurans]|uniref:sensor histidine kinase n=1 Tax=Cupriavidus TaxID=106589 RepID=UPI0002A46258|nr:MULTISPECIES: sensor histidine kinase [Cupriavidus]EKZ99442.1 sensor protein in two-component regulatory system [Cupriavidus sp. HMR-1]GMG93146.1 two-component sensor [Cupriavidus sp. TKC]HBD34657.1 sensor histidine kinase [Cupriavidus sp.]